MLKNFYCQKIQTQEVGRTSAGAGRAHCVPFLHQLSASHRGNRDVYQPNITALVLFPLPVGVFIQVQSDGIDGWKTAKVKTLTPEHIIGLQFTRRPGIQTVIQTQLAKVPAVQIQQSQLGAHPDSYSKKLISTTKVPLLGR